jgi:hypothetical protein
MRMEKKAMHVRGGHEGSASDELNNNQKAVQAWPNS